MIEVGKYIAPKPIDHAARTFLVNASHSKGIDVDLKSNVTIVVGTNTLIN